MQIGIDLGGTKIEFAALAEDGAILCRNRVPSPVDDYPATIEAIRLGIGEIEQKTGQSGTVGIGIPGTLSPATGLVKNANSTWLIGKPLDKDLEQALGRPVRLANDANCFALSEAVDGAGKDADVVFGVILGTGVGGGIVIHRRLVSGPNAIAGEWGHNTQPLLEIPESEARPCYCGRVDCIETHLCGPALSRDYASITKTHIPAAEVALRAQNGERNALQVLQAYERKLAAALAQIINILDPDVIVLGGGLSNMDRLYVSVPALWGQWVFSDSVTTRLVPPIHGDSSGVRGAAWLWAPES